MPASEAQVRRTARLFPSEMLSSEERKEALFSCPFGAGTVYLRGKPAAAVCGKFAGCRGLSHGKGNGVRSMHTKKPVTPRWKKYIPAAAAIAAVLTLLCVAWFWEAPMPEDTSSLLLGAELSSGDVSGKTKEEIPSTGSASSPSSSVSRAPSVSSASDTSSASTSSEAESSGSLGYTEENLSSKSPSSSVSSVSSAAPAVPVSSDQSGESGGEKMKTCRFSISCASVLSNMELCDPEKRELIPADGWLLEETVVSFQEGESVFDILRRVCREKGIHMEYTGTPGYKGAYIEGIGNLYEFDVGELSGWMYSFNGRFPNYSSAAHTVQEGDRIAWVYSCDMGRDVGGSAAAKGE